MKKFMLNTDQIKKEGQIDALSKAIDSRLWEISWLHEATRSNGRFCGLGAKLGRARELIAETDDLLKEIQSLDGQAN
jgi:hypothetical protein